MGRKFIIEEVEEESKFGCGSIVATIIIALVIGLCGGFKSLASNHFSWLMSLVSR